MKKILISIWMVLFLCSIGCAGTGLIGAGISALSATSIALSGAALVMDVTNLKKAIDASDYKSSFQMEFNQVWTGSLAAIEELGIKIIDKQMEPKKGAGFIKGETTQHEIEVALVATTPKVISVGIKARKPGFMGGRDMTFGATIANAITRNCARLAINH